MPVKTFRFIFSLGLASLGSSAFASPWFLPDPIAWYKRTNDVITKNGLHTQVETLGYALVFALFAYGALRASYYARSSEFGALLGRLLLAAGILLSLTPIRGVVHGTWVAAFEWSSGLFNEVEKELVENADEVTLLLAPFFAAGTTINFIGRRVAAKGASAIAQTGTSAVSGVANRATTYMTGVLFLFFPLFGMYAALIYASGFIVLLSMLLLPLAGALLLLPNGASWISRWLGMYIAALFTVIFLPIIFGIAVDLGLVQPLARMGSYMQDALTQFSEAADALTLPSGSEVWRVAEWQDWLQNVPDSLLNTLAGIGNILLGWLLSLVALIVGMLIGVYLLMNLPGFVGGFIGGIGASAGAAFALARPARGGSRVERTTNNSMNALVMMRSPGDEDGRALPAPGPGGARNG